MENELNRYEPMVVSDIDKTKIENYKINDCLVDSSWKSWFITAIDLESETLILQHYLTKVEEEVCLKNAKQVDFIKRVMRSERDVERLMLEDFQEKFFNKKDILSYKRHDMINDRSNKSWIIHKVNRAENTFEVIKHPRVKAGEKVKNVFFKVDITDPKIVALIKGVYRTEND